jgi:ABC-type transport system involved in cytochrome c biogenesis permease subunit
LLEVFRIDNEEVRSLLALPDFRQLPTGGQGDYRKYFSLVEIAPNGQKLTAEFDKANALARDKRTTYHNKVLELGGHVNHFIRLKNLGGLFVVPPLEPGKEWRNLGDVAQTSRSTGQRDESAVAFLKILESYHGGKPQEFNEAVAAYSRTIQAASNPQLRADVSKAGFETFYNRFDPLGDAMVLYVIGFILVAFAWLGWTKTLGRAAIAIIVIAFIAHTFGLAARMYISGRPPVTNLYSSAVFIAWGGVLLCLIVEGIFRNTLGTFVATVIGFAPLLIANGLANVDASKGQADTMAQLQAVLDTNFWLATHVIAITVGYLAVFVAAVMGIVYILGGILTPYLAGENRKNLSRMIYGTSCFAMIFSFVGTILGGIWADQSWGRFWGWDPKENGAILIVLWIAIVLHARWGGVVRERGVAVLSVFGGIVTAWSWFGTNMLGVGLHSYGFMDQALMWLGIYAASQLAIMGTALLPLEHWRSFAGAVPPTLPKKAPGVMKAAPVT